MQVLSKEASNYANIFFASLKNANLLYVTVSQIHRKLTYKKKYLKKIPYKIDTHSLANCRIENNLRRWWKTRWQIHRLGRLVLKFWKMYGKCTKIERLLHLGGAAAKFDCFKVASLVSRWTIVSNLRIFAFSKLAILRTTWTYIRKLR